MEEFVKGDVIVLNFPFSDLTSTKKRPALVIATFSEDFILCQITSQAHSDPLAIPLNQKDFDKGGLNIPSFIRIDRLFTADRSLLLYKVGTVRRQKLSEVIDTICKMLKK